MCCLLISNEVVVMKFNTFATSQQDIEQCATVEILDEVLLEPTLLARQGRLSPAEAFALADQARDHNLRPILVWDILMPERVMTDVCQQLSDWDLTKFSAIRVCDVGAALWLKANHPDLPLQLIVETGNHNKEALIGWCEMFAPALERLILSIELPEEKLIEYCQDLPVACELLGVGQILLFYSPRSLLAEHLDEEDDDQPRYIEATATSEKASFKPFPTVETGHGTLMFLDKDQFILDRFEALADAGLHTLRLDLRHLGQNGHTAQGIDTLCEQIVHDATTLRKNWPRTTRAPFFKANKTTAQFGHMKSKQHAQRDETCLAEVLGGEKRKYVIMQALQSFDDYTAKSLALPDGNAVPITEPLTFRDWRGETRTQIEDGQIFMTSWIKKSCAGALLRNTSDN